MLHGITLFGVSKEIQHIGHHPEPKFHQHGAFNEDNIVSSEGKKDTTPMNNLATIEHQPDPK